SVITAAIAAYEGKETVDNGLVVRSIKRVSNRNWN
ncbi:MAG: sodium pump decarboxylase, gamma subunit, partial [Faecalibacterium prausnitzii]|nr:sodium pump decarboxylase, gamma subunit [Faecalibacterium prausnitzii]